MGKRLERTAGQDKDIALRSIRGVRTKLVSKLRNRKYWAANKTLLQKNKNKTKEAYLLPSAELALAQPLKYIDTEPQLLEEED